MKLIDAVENKRDAVCMRLYRRTIPVSVSINDDKCTDRANYYMCTMFIDRFTTNSHRLNPRNYANCGSAIIERPLVTDKYYEHKLLNGYSQHHY